MSNLEQKYALLEDDTGSEHESQNFDHSSPKTTRKSRSTILLAGSGLKRDIPVPWPVYSPFDNRSDPKATDKEWEKIGKIRLGVIALPDSCVAEKGLRKAQRFPWDNSKGVYLINANHNLSCLLKLRISLLEFHRGEERSGIFAHVTHCLDALRQGIKFNADDTPDGLAMDIVSPADPYVVVTGIFWTNGPRPLHHVGTKSHLLRTSMSASLIALQILPTRTR